MKKFVLFGLVFLAACGAKKGPQTSLITPDPFIRTGTQIEGRASWYGGRFHGRKTASGEVYNKFALTAAHKTLPFGTLLEVTNPENNKKIVVRVTDRGPYIKGRFLDLSQAAAEKLGMKDKGTSQVVAEICVPKAPALAYLPRLR